MAQVRLSYWIKFLGGWDFTDGEEVEIPDEIIERYNQAKEEYERALEAVDKAKSAYIKNKNKSVRQGIKG